MALKQSAIAKSNTNALKSYYLAEGGQEDAVYRIIKGKSIDATETIALNGSTVATNILTVGDTREITSEGNVQAHIRRVKTVIKKTATSVDFHYGVQVGQGGLDMGNNARVNGNVYSNNSITGDSGATIMGDATVAGGLPASPTMEWATNNADHFFATASTNRDIAQSFTATASGPVPQVAVYLAKVGSPSSNITVRITNDNSGKPSTSSLANGTIVPSNVGSTPSWINVSFASPATVSSGTKYWIVLDYGSDSATNHWNWRKDTGDAYAGNTGRYTSSWSSGGAVWTDVGGDLAFRAWIGSTATKIDKMIIGDAATGTGRANLFVNTTIHGSSCPNAYCMVDNPAQEALPISDGVIQDWKNDAASGGTTAGDVTVTGTQTIGPRKITGKLIFTNGATLTVAGTLWVVGDIVFDNNSTVRLDPSYGTLSDVIISDSKIDVKNNSTFSGSGDPASFLMLLAAKDSTGEELITVDNNSEGVIYYAGKGWIKISNNAEAKEVTAYGIRLDNNALITYDAGLANAQFSSGPGAGFEVQSWREIE